ncbi:phage holin family protein [Roseinatronobacter alkalisoli]|uniref:Phage holin family protein n=1 Tax=Roseinatronobacter alkalisoli TaxID=3028235 RepID=A0ABT5T9F9_9RHOB|nr:phage holin family protein [Roseinatronobacter sp. HJB301]MDD7971360.1 phage holin family protein [Roseinatronobacter sp. HJB301]
MLRTVYHLQRKARWHSGNVALAVCAGAMLAIGLGFLVAAGWMLLAQQFSALIANYVIALIFLGLAAVLLLIRRIRPAPQVPSLDAQLRAEAAAGRSSPPQGEFPALIEAFLFGINTYVQLKNRPRRRE